MFPQESVVPLVEDRRTRVVYDNGRETMRDPFITIYLDFDTSSCEGLGVRESIVSEDVNTGTLYY